MSSVSVLMKLTGKSSGWIKGECDFPNFKEQIEISDWTWLLQRKQETGDSEPGLFSFTKLMDRATTAMLSALREGEPMTADITVEDFAEKGFELHIKLTDALLIDYSFDAKTEDGQGEVEEKWKFDYKTILFQHRDDPKKGLIDVKLVRPTNAERNASKTTAEKMVDLASEMAPGELTKLWEKLLDAAEKGKFKTDAKKPATDKATIGS